MKTFVRRGASRAVRRFAILVLGGVVLAGSFAGCEKKAGKRQPAKAVQATAQNGVAAAPEKFVEPAVKDEPPFLYLSEGKRDPFLSLIVPTGKVEKQVDMTQVLPLQVYDTADHKVIGIIDLGEQGMTAMLVRPDGKGFSVQVGAPVGQRGGRVSAIDMSAVHIEETVPDYRGNPTLQTMTLELRKEEQ